MNNFERQLLAAGLTITKPYLSKFERLKRKLTKEEHVHHKDADKLNDDFDNFLILTNGNHKKIHAKAYDFIVQTGQIDEYLIWLKANHSERECKTMK